MHSKNIEPWYSLPNLSTINLTADVEVSRDIWYTTRYVAKSREIRLPGYLRSKVTRTLSKERNERRPRERVS